MPEGDRRFAELERSRPGFLSRRSNPDNSRPYLEFIPGDYGAQLELFEWLELLVSRAGHDGAVSALEFYESIEWLSAESRQELEEFVRGISTTEGGDGSLDIADHRESLVYIVRLSEYPTR